jgi:hypothetical protein
MGSSRPGDSEIVEPTIEQMIAWSLDANQSNTMRLTLQDHVLWHVPTRDLIEALISRLTQTVADPRSPRRGDQHRLWCALLDADREWPASIMNYAASGSTAE